MKKIITLLSIFVSSYSFAQIGIYDMQFSTGVTFTKPKKGMDNLDADFGTNYDLGFTVLNLAHTEGQGSASTLSLHYDYSRQNFGTQGFSVGSWHFRRNEIYARFKPLTNNAAYSSTFDGRGSMYLLAMIFSGLYVDVGYSNGSYFYKDLMDVRQKPNHSQNGMFWGWGYNIVYRTDRVGMSVGYGSKIYKWTKDNDNKSKYSSRTIWLGVTYNFVWKE